MIKMIYFDRQIYTVCYKKSPGYAILLNQSGTDPTADCITFICLFFIRNYSQFWTMSVFKKN